MRADDPFGAAERDQRLEPKDIGCGVTLLFPQTRHHELEVRRLDPVPQPALRSGGAFATAVAQGDLSGPQLIEDRVSQGRLNADGRGTALSNRVELRQRTLDRIHCGVAIEVIDPQVVVKQARDATLEPVQLRQRIVADRDQEIRPQVARGDGLGELGRERSAGRVGWMVEKVLFELVQDNQEIGVVRRAQMPECAAQSSGRRAIRRPAGGVGQRRVNPLEQPPHGIVAPRTEHDDDVLRRGAGRRVTAGGFSKAVRHPGAQHGALAHAAGPVEQRQPIGLQVGSDDLLLVLAPEEERCILLGERNESFIRTVGDAR